MNRLGVLVTCLLLCSCATRDDRAPYSEDTSVCLSCTVDGEAYVLVGWLRAPADSRNVPSGFVLIPEKAYADCTIEHQLVYSAGSWWSNGRKRPVIPWVDWIAILHGPTFEPTRGTVYLARKDRDSWLIFILVDRLPPDTDVHRLIRAISESPEVRVVFTGKQPPNLK